MEASARRLLGRYPKTLSQLLRFVVVLTPAGVLRSNVAVAHSLTLTCFIVVPKAGVPRFLD